MLLRHAMSELTCTVLQLAMIAKDLGEPLSEEELTLLAAEIDKDNRFCSTPCAVQPNPLAHTMIVLSAAKSTGTSSLCGGRWKLKN